MKRIVCLLLAIILTFGTAFVLGSCDAELDFEETTEEEQTTKAPKETEDEDEEKSTKKKKETTEPEQTTEPEIDGVFEPTDSETNYVLIRVKDYGDIIVELYPQVAPITVTNFKDLVSEGFYDGLTFHRVVEGFMIQGGDPEGDGTGGSGENIIGEFSANGIENNLSHDRGVISMARGAYSMDSASSQFFIMHESTYKTSLDGYYAAFGKVVFGMDVVDAIATAETQYNIYGEQSQPVKTITMEKVCFVEPVEEETLGET